MDCVGSSKYFTGKRRRPLEGIHFHAAQKAQIHKSAPAGDSELVPCLCCPVAKLPASAHSVPCQGNPFPHLEHGSASDGVAGQILNEALNTAPGPQNMLTQCWLRVSKTLIVNAAVEPVFPCFNSGLFYSFSAVLSSTHPKQGNGAPCAPPLLLPSDTATRCLPSPC